MAAYGVMLGTKAIVATDREAPYVLDEILGNQTDLPIIEHATDTHGASLINFAPVRPGRTATLAPYPGPSQDHSVSHRHPGRHLAAEFPRLGPLLTRKINLALISEIGTRTHYGMRSRRCWPRWVPENGIVMFDTAQVESLATAGGRATSPHHGRAQWRPRQHLTREPVERRMRGNALVQCGGQAGETGRERSRNRAPVRPLHHRQGQQVTDRHPGRAHHQNRDAGADP